MDKDQLSFSDVERLLSEMAQQDRSLAAHDDAQTELMRGIARQEIRRVFFRRRCLRVSGSVAMLILLGGGVSLLLPELAADAGSLATALSAKRKAGPVPQLREQASPPPIGYTTTMGGKEHACEVVIYAVPL